MIPIFFKIQIFRKRKTKGKAKHLVKKLILGSMKDVGHDLLPSHYSICPLKLKQFPPLKM